jgi:hypothetical protein
MKGTEIIYIYIYVYMYVYIHTYILHFTIISSRVSFEQHRTWFPAI